MKVLLVLSLLSLSACAAAQVYAPGGGLNPIVEEPTKSTLTREEAEKIVLKTRSSLWKDPLSIREAKSGQTSECQFDDVSSGKLIKRAGTCICIELNAKNAMCGYVGLQRAKIGIPEEGEPQVI